MEFHRVLFLVQCYSFIHQWFRILHWVWQTNVFCWWSSIFISGKSINSVQGKVNDTINKLTEWLNRNKFIINEVKMTAILFHQPQKIHFEFPLIKLDNSVINYSDHLKFLGVWLDNNLNWSINTRDPAKS
jgi:hypothetical protein